MAASIPALADSLALQVLQRDWLSANHIVFAGGEAPATVVDTGYARHAELTIALLAHALGGQALQRIVNTHLHSDHCGGNHALQARWSGLQTLVPAASFGAVAQWDEAVLSYRATGQHCERFQVDGMLQPGEMLALGAARWQVLAAGGHDPDAVMLFEPQTRTLISGDALWEDRLAIIFPEIEGEPGFGPARETLARIEALRPRWVIPGHGAAFEDAGAALAASRRRLDAFERDPARHLRHAARALVMFHMMEVQQHGRAALQAWLQATPIFQRMAARSAGPAGIPAWAADLVAGL
ncbi:MAG TPA: MBL fold metallo-hydrolase, partial [Ideonella sp.]|nr:MBL fold metallo-hydrolase [Ideonella sp.]